MVRIGWSSLALQHLREIRDYIGKGSKFQAARVVALIKSSVRKLKRHPEFGAVVPEYGMPSIRELRVFHYRIFYRIAEEKDEIEILSVYHGSRQLTDDMVE